MSENSEQKKKNGVLLGLLDVFETITFAIAVVVIIFSFFTRMCVVKGDSMNPTLIDGERLLVSDLLYEPECGDIIVFHQTGSTYNEPLVKRVIAVGGETIDIDFDTWTVTVTDPNGNKRILDETYAQFVGNPLRSNQVYPLYVPEGYVFVMGDNRFNSADSRLTSIGLVDERRILGKAIIRIAPLDKFGIID